ncbi:unnamed protein product, partial [Ectocarpus sp. 12 AP-2014]
MTDTRHLVCPHCHKVNRVPADKLSSGGNCGACKQPLWPDQVLELGDQSFAAHTARSDVPVLVDFWASWCGPCKVMAPQFEQAAKAWRGKVRFAKLNTGWPIWYSQHPDADPVSEWPRGGPSEWCHESGADQPVAPVERI